MQYAQKGILAEVPPHSRYVLYDLPPGIHAKDALKELLEVDVSAELLIALGPSLVFGAGGAIEGLHAHPPMVGPGISVPSTPFSMLAWHRGTDRGDLVLASRELEDDLAAFFEAKEVIDSFRYMEGRDLTGHLDGTENPKGAKAMEAALVSGAGEGMDDSSFVALQKWEHDLDEFFDVDEKERDLIVGRRIDDDTEIEDAPETAHVKRTEQESFEPPAFMLRRSMPWADEDGEGLVFFAFGRSFDAFEAILRRMVGLDDGIVDALFDFTHPTLGAYFWCPPVRDGVLDLSALGISSQ
jgi:putative iron-dependent peroxidase